MKDGQHLFFPKDISCVPASASSSFFHQTESKKESQTSKFPLPGFDLSNFCPLQLNSSLEISAVISPILPWMVRPDTPSMHPHMDLGISISEERLGFKTRPHCKGYMNRIYIYIYVPFATHKSQKHKQHRRIT